MELTKKEAIIAAILLLTMGISGHGLYLDYQNERTLNGLYISGTDNYSKVQDYSYNHDKKGDWVCVNVAFDMTPKEAYATCIHECSHKAFSEIYAEDCEDKPLECLEGLNG